MIFTPTGLRSPTICRGELQDDLESKSSVTEFAGPLVALPIGR